MNIIIPATGIGKRFKDAGYKELKPFINVKNNKVILDYVIECFDIKNDKFYFIIQKKEYEKFYNFIKTRNINAEIVLYHGEKLGPAGALYGVKDELQNIINEEVIISYCDFGQKWNYEDFLNFIKKYNYAQSIIPCYTGYHPHLIPMENVYAVCKTYNNSYEVFSVIEKYNSYDKFNEYHSSGVYYFRSLNMVLSAIKKQIDKKDMLNGEYYISTTNNYLDKVLCYPFVEKFYQFGTPIDFEYAKSKLNLGEANNDSVKLDNIVLLSAGRGERFLNLNFDQPKPFLPLKKSTIIENIIETFKNIDSNIIYVGAQDHKKYWENIDQEVRFVQPNKIGAAYSYKEACSNLNGEVLILPCDLIAKHVNEEFKLLRQKYDVIIFAINPSKYNYENPNYFTWIKGKNNLVEKISVKYRSDDSNFVMIGSFYFKNNSLLISYIEKIFKDNINTSGEFFIDNVFNLIIKNYKIAYAIVENYFSFGTPEEYAESVYWLKD
ncbi:sugar phosphate nucleotidyltransferase [Campylobacter molothri]|uniref:sugar phosphate nucleotidyltransferase n=1 Tax=Campylobacter molothri TaxID=1032242 RepID=UPI00301E4F4E|nr:NTP transferase domain-containing protein [Campylobacter sp. RM17709]